MDHNAIALALISRATPKGICTQCRGDLLKDELERGDTVCGLCVIDSALPSWRTYLATFDAYLYSEGGEEARAARRWMEDEFTKLTQGAFPLAA